MPDDGTSWDALAFRAEEYAAAGDFPRATDCLADALRLCIAAGDDLAIADLQARLGELHTDQGNNDEAIIALKDALGRYQSLRKPAAVARVHRILGAAYRKSGVPKLAVEHLEAAEKQFRRVQDDSEWALLQIELGELNEERSDFREAVQRYTKALTVSEKRGDDAAIANCLWHLGSVLRERGDVPDALEHINRALGILEAAGATDKPELIAVYLQMGSALHDQGNPDAALDRIRRALDLAEAIDNKPARGEALLGMGAAHLSRGDFAQAEDCFDRAIRIAEEQRDVVNLSEAHGFLGEVYEAQGQLDAAITSFKAALSLDQGHHDDLLGIARSHRRLGSAYRKMGSFDRAKEAFEEAHALLRRSEDDSERAILYLNWGALEEDRGQFLLALDQYNRALTTYERTNNPLGQATCLRHLGSVRWEQGDFSAATEHLNRALGLLESLGSQHKPELIAVYTVQGAVLEDAGHPDDALRRFRQALDWADALGLTPSQGEVLRRMGTAYMQKGEFEKARDALRRAVRISEELEDDVLTAKARARYGEVLQALGDLDGAIDSFREALNKEQRHQNIIGMAKAHRRLGSAFHRKGHFPRAQEAFEEAAALLRGAEDEVASALLATSEGELHQDAGRFDQALDSYESALVVTERRGNAVGIANCLRHLGSLSVELGEAPSAAEHLNRAQGIHESLGSENRPELAAIQGLLAAVYGMQGQAEAAITAHRKALDLAEAMDFPLARARAHVRLAAALAAHGDMSLARDSVEKADRICDELGDEFFMCDVRVARAQLLEREEEYDQASEEYASAARLLDRAGRHPTLTLALVGNARCQRQLGDHDRAGELLDQADEVTAQIEGSPKVKADLWIERAAQFERAGVHEEAGEYYERALDLLTKLNDPAGVALCHNRLIGVALNNNDRAKAMFHALEVAAVRPDSDPSAWAAMLHALSPTIAQQALPSFKVGEYQSAVSAAFRVCEEAFASRSSGRPDSSRRGASKDIAFWLTKERRGLAPWVTADELGDFQKFCQGAFGAARNPHNHRTVAMEATEAFCWIAVAHLMLALLDQPPGDGTLAEAVPTADTNG